jgi:aryl-alcohol dehydrogenase-like predicted oxidoreductase
MLRRPLGKTGTTVSAIGLGCMGMSEFYGPGDDQQSLETLATALDQGIDFLDTADMYGVGHNEELLGRFLKGRRERVVLATKFGIVRSRDNPAARRIDNSPQYIRQACDASLRRLGIDTIDLYYIHRRDRSVPVEDAVGAMAELVQAGKVRYLGLSEVAPETLRRAHAVHPITAIQSEYSLWSRGPEREMRATCRELGVTFIAYSPLGRAILTGAVKGEESFAPGDFRRSNPRFQGNALR